MKKKFLTILLTLAAALCLCFGLVACDNGSGNSATDSSSTTEQGGNGSTKPDEGGSTKPDEGGTGGSAKPDEGGSTTKPDEGGTTKPDEGGSTKPEEHVHSFTNYVYNNDATCTEDGTETATCTCGVSDTRPSAGTATGHSYTVENLCSGCGDQWKFTEGLTYELDPDTNTYTVTNIGTASGDIVIPYGYQDKMVTKIGDGAFENSNSTVTSILIPDSVTSIGHRAFRGCSDLTSVTIGSGVTSIGSYAFWDCSGLTSVIWNAENCTSAGSESSPVFSNCTKLSSVTFGENVKTIPAYAFLYCSGLTGELKIPDAVTSIGRSAFYGCRGLTGVYITDLSAWCRIDLGNSSANPLSYAHHLYVNNVELTKLVIPDEITAIKPYAFYGCSGLTSITIPDSVTSIGVGAFEDCSGLTSITIPNGVTSIGGWAFYYCTGLTSITIPDSVTSIGTSAFYGCSGLESVTIGSGVTSIGHFAFRGCSSLTSIEIPDSVTSIGDMAFYGCILLESIVIPDVVTSIGEYTFYGCSGLKNIYFKGTRTQWNSITKGTGWDWKTGDYTLITDWTGSGLGQTGYSWELEKKNFTKNTRKIKIKGAYNK